MIITLACLRQNCSRVPNHIPDLVFRSIQRERDYDAVPPVPVKKKSTAHMHSPVSQRANGTPPSIPPHRSMWLQSQHFTPLISLPPSSAVSVVQGDATPPPPPVRRNMTSGKFSPSSTFQFNTSLSSPPLLLSLLQLR